MTDIQEQVCLTTADTLQLDEVDYYQFFPVEKLTSGEREQVERLIDFLKNYQPEVKS